MVLIAGCGPEFVGIATIPEPEVIVIDGCEEFVPPPPDDVIVQRDVGHRGEDDPDVMQLDAGLADAEIP